MKQQVNFVSFLPAQTQDALSFATLVILSLIFLIVLIVAYVTSYWQVDQLKKQLSEMRVQQVSTSNKIVGLAKELLNTTDNQQVKQRLHYLSDVAQGQDQVVQALSKRNQTVTSGFYAPLTALAKSIVTGVWLTQIKMVRTTHTIRLKGMAVQSQLVKQEIEALERSTYFSGWRFKLVELHQRKQAKHTISEFILEGQLK